MKNQKKPGDNVINDRFGILIIEDNEDHAELMKLAFREDPSIELVFARSLRETRKLLSGRHFDLIISDMKLPDGDGLDFITKEEISKQVPGIIIITSFGDEDRAVQAMKAGVLDYKVKTDELLLNMDKIARRAKYNILGERKRKEAEQLLKTIFETARDYIFIKDRQLRYTMVNPAITEMLELNESDILDKTDRELFGMREFEHTSNIDRRVLKGETVKEERELVVNGKMCTCHFIKVPIRDSEDNISGLYGIGRDITERKRSESSLKRAKKEALEANRAKGRFLANITHELKTPLQGIIGFSKLLEESADDELIHKIREQIGYIKKSAEHLSDVLNEILDLSKINAGKLRLEKSPFNLKEAAGKALDATRFFAEEKNISEGFNAGTYDIYIEADETRIRQAIYNLLTNAIKFTPENREIGLDLSRDDENITIKVWDQGEGIEEEELEKIFEPFERKAHEKESGTGLGLSITKEIVEMHGGVVEVESESGLGSVFSIKLPVKSVVKPPVKKTEDERQEVQRKGSKRALVVEDDLISRKFIMLYLKKIFPGLDSAENGEEALRQLSEKKYDIVFMDIQLPDTNGDVIVKKMKAEDALNSQTPFVAVTAYYSEELEQHLLDSGFDQYLAKPIDFDVLKNIIDFYF